MLDTIAKSALDFPFWQGLAEGRLQIQQCSSCETWTWPPQWRCGSCGSWELTWPEVPMEGKVHAFTHTRHPFSPEMNVPLVNLLVELPHAGGARLLGVLRGSEEGLATGALLVGEIDMSAGDLPALRWRLAEAGGPR